jgi:hypothetical protein
VRNEVTNNSEGHLRSQLLARVCQYNIIIQDFIFAFQSLVLTNNNTIPKNTDIKYPCSYLRFYYCNHCEENLAEIFQDNGDYCLECWQDLTYPKL